MFKRSNLVAPALAAAAMAAGTAAQAAVPEGVTTAIAAIGTDSIAIATTVLLAVVGVFAIKFLRKGL